MTNRSIRDRKTFGRGAAACACGLAVLVFAAACTSASSSDNQSVASSATAGVTAVQTTADGAESSSENSAPTTSYDGGTVASAPAPSIEPPATTPVAAPGGGDINQTVAAVELTTLPAVAVTDKADLGNGVSVRLDSVEAVHADAQLPGEIAGPGVKVAVVIKNDSPAAIDISNVGVDVVDAAGTPTIFMSASPSAPFTGQLAAGSSATGVYVFALPASYTDPAAISVSYSTDAPIALFSGTAK